MAATLTQVDPAVNTAPESASVARHWRSASLQQALGRVRNALH